MTASDSRSAAAWMYKTQRIDMNVAGTVSVKICAADPLTRLGLVSHVRQEPRMTPVDDQSADVIVLTVGNADDQALDTLRQLTFPACAGFLVIVAGSWTVDMHAAIELGVRGVLFRCGFSWASFDEAVYAIARGEGAFSPELQGMLLDQMERTIKDVLAPRGLTACGLTTREIDILRLVANGSDLEDIAEKLRYSERTVKNVLYGLMKRLNLRNRAHAVSYAIRAGVI
ncbi:response regulator transcription factor [Streptomyces sp. NPDC006476]|uniref:response regulator transcription factor n=1 Tax=Streptomyces sp. NPDC006476 TaxID=3157175 RepID=UPI0033AC54AE